MSKKITSVMFVIVAIVFIGLGIRENQKLNQDPIDMSEIEWSEIKKGDIVELTIDVVWDCFYTETTTEKTYFITTNEYESARGYAIPHLFVDNQGYYDIDYFVGVRLNEKEDYDLMEQILDETNAWYFDTTGTVDYGMTTFELKGEVVNMTEEEMQFMMEYLTVYCGYSDSEAREVIVPCMIKKLDPNAGPGMMFAGGFMFVIGVIIFIVMSIQEKKQKEMNSRYASYTPINKVDENAYYTPDNSVPLSGGYQYGGTNSYGQNDIYGGSSYTPTQNKIDESTGLSMEFLQRSEEEKAQREREAQYKAPEPTHNPLYGNQAPTTPVNPSDSFSSYEDTVKNTGNFGGGIYGTRNDNQ